MQTGWLIGDSKPAHEPKRVRYGLACQRRFSESIVIIYVQHRPTISSQLARASKCVERIECGVAGGIAPRHQTQCMVVMGQKAPARIIFRYHVRETSRI